MGDGRVPRKKMVSIGQRNVAGVRYFKDERETPASVRRVKARDAQPPARNDGLCQTGTDGRRGGWRPAGPATATFSSAKEACDANESCMGVYQTWNGNFEIRNSCCGLNARPHWCDQSVCNKEERGVKG